MVARYMASIWESVSKKPSNTAFVDVFAGQLGRLKRLVAGMGLGVSEAEDVLQDVFLTTLKHHDKFGDAQQALPQLTRVTINRCLLEFRRQKRFRRAAKEILQRRLASQPASAGPGEAAIRAEELEIVRQMLQQLDESLIAPLVLRYYADLNSTQIGQILELPASTIRSQLRKGRMLLAKGLMERGVEP